MFNNSLYSHFYRSNLIMLCKRVFKEEIVITSRVNSKLSTRPNVSIRTQNQMLLFVTYGSFIFKIVIYGRLCINMIVKIIQNWDINLRCKNENNMLKSSVFALYFYILFKQFVPTCTIHVCQHVDHKHLFLH